MSSAMEYIVERGRRNWAPAWGGAGRVPKRARSIVIKAPAVASSSGIHVSTSATGHTAYRSNFKKKKRGSSKKFQTLANGLKAKAVKLQDATQASIRRVRYLTFASVNRFGDDGGTFALSAHNKSSWYAVPALLHTFLDQALEQVTAVTAVNVTPIIPVLFGNSRCKILLKNNFSQNIEITEYRCYPRRDLDAANYLSPLFAQDDFDDAGAATPNLMNQVVASFPAPAAGGLAITAVDMNQYSATPFDSQSWVNAFNIKEGETRCLMPGEEWRSTIQIPKKNRMKVLNKKRYDMVTGDTFSAKFRMLKDNGVLALFRVRGCLAHDEGALAASGTLTRNRNLEVHYGGYQVDISMEYEYSYTYVPSINQVSFMAGQYGTFPVPATTQAQSNAFVEAMNDAAENA